MATDVRGYDVYVAVWEATVGARTNTALQVKGSNIHDPYAFAVVENDIGANCPKTPGTVPDLECLSRVSPGNENLPRMSRNSTNP